jgi:hypothetical protein
MYIEGYVKFCQDLLLYLKLWYRKLSLKQMNIVLYFLISLIQDIFFRVYLFSLVLFGFALLFYYILFDFSKVLILNTLQVES